MLGLEGRGFRVQGLGFAKGCRVVLGLLQAGEKFETPSVPQDVLF